MKDPHILLVEDEERLAEVLRKHFQESGFKIDIAKDGYEGRRMADERLYNIIILDINLPLINGIDLCREIRKINKGIPIIMLTALGTMDDKLTGFQAGADDYVIKPFNFRELLARVNVFLRRSEPVKSSEKLSIADLVLDVNHKTVTRSARRIELTAKEFLLLEVLLRNKEQVISRDSLIEQVWGIDFDPGTNILDVYINYLRKKIDKDFSPKLIHTRYGFGFYIGEEDK